MRVPYPFGEGGLLHVDACCWIDLFATDCLEEIIRSVPCRWAVSEYVLREEVLSVVSNARIEERCDFLPLTKGGLISVLPIQSAAEKNALVQFAAYLDDGEASVCALARVHGGGVATNDRRVRTVMSRLMVQIPIVQTPEIIFHWAQQTQATREGVKEVLRKITTRARFSPRKDAPHSDWWYGNSGVDVRE